MTEHPLTVAPPGSKPAASYVPIAPLYETITLPEGLIELTIPGVPISAVSIQDLVDHFALIIKKLRRRNEVPARRRRRQKALDQRSDGFANNPKPDERETGG